MSAAQRMHHGFSSEVGFIGDLFIACIKALTTLATSCDSPEIKPRIQEEKGRLALWGDGFDVYEGELDLLLERSGHLKESAVVLLASIASTVVKHLDPASSDLIKSISGLVEKAEKLVPETANYVGHDDDDSDDDSDTEFSDIVDEIKEFNDSLYDLVPFLESGQTHTPNGLEDCYPGILLASHTSDLSSSTNLSNTRIEAQFYQRNILDKFPEANPDLVAVMAELNWLRHERIRRISAREEEEEPMDEPTFSEGFTASEGYTFTNPTSFQSSSIFSRAMSTASSVGSSVYEYNPPAAGNGYVRFPNPPTKLGSGEPFTCTICSQTLKNIYSKDQWRKHVLKDLEPYSCTFTSCLSQTETFSTRKSWLAHEFENHRFITKWVCIKDCGEVFNQKDLFVTHIQNDHFSKERGSLAATELEAMISLCEQRHIPPSSSTIICPFCSEELEETRIVLHSHLGIHMEQIALTVLPQDIWGEGGEDEDEERDILIATKAEGWLVGEGGSGLESGSDDGDTDGGTDDGDTGDGDTCKKIRWLRKDIEEWDIQMSNTEDLMENTKLNSQISDQIPPQVAKLPQTKELPPNNSTAENLVEFQYMKQPLHEFPQSQQHLQPNQQPATYPDHSYPTKYTTLPQARWPDLSYRVENTHKPSPGEMERPTENIARTIQSNKQTGGAAWERGEIQTGGEGMHIQAGQGIVTSEWQRRKLQKMRTQVEQVIIKSKERKREVEKIRTQAEQSIVAFEKRRRQLEKMRIDAERAIAASEERRREAGAALIQPGKAITASEKRRRQERARIQAEQDIAASEEQRREVEEMRIQIEQRIEASKEQKRELEETLIQVEQDIAVSKEQRGEIEKMHTQAEQGIVVPEEQRRQVEKELADSLHKATEKRDREAKRNRRRADKVGSTYKGRERPKVRENEVEKAHREDIEFAHKDVEPDYYELDLPHPPVGDDGVLKNNELRLDDIIRAQQEQSKVLQRPKYPGDYYNHYISTEE